MSVSIKSKPLDIIYAYKKAILEHFHRADTSLIFEDLDKEEEYFLENLVLWEQIEDTLYYESAVNKINPLYCQAMFKSINDLKSKFLSIDELVGLKIFNRGLNDHIVRLYKRKKTKDEVNEVYDDMSEDDYIEDHDFHDLPARKSDGIKRILKKQPDGDYLFDIAN